MHIHLMNLSLPVINRISFWVVGHAMPVICTEALVMSWRWSGYMQMGKRRKKMSIPQRLATEVAAVTLVITLKPRFSGV